MNQYLRLIKSQEQVRGSREDASGAIDEVIPSRNRVWISFQHGGSLHQLSACILHSGDEKKMIDLKKKHPQNKSC